MKPSIDDRTRAAADRFLGETLKRFPVSQAVLFGSRARGTHYESSDADIAVVLNGPPADFLQTKLMMADIAFDVLLETGILVQPLPIWKAEWEEPTSYANPSLIANIRREGLEL